MEGSFGDNKFFSNANDLSPEVVLGVLVGAVIVLGLVMFAVYRYQRWKRFRNFVDEMQQLGLNPLQEGTFGDLVRRYKMNDPVQILYSLRMFDEMAAREMNRVLSSPGSMNAKDEFITTLYEIRERTYLSGNSDGPRRPGEPTGDPAETALT